MTDRAALVRLAALIGIDTGYTDALGQTREASDDTLLALIGAFGLPADPEQAASELEERRRAVPLGLGPAHLVHAEAPHPELTLRLPPRTREVAWTCRLEDGEERIGRAAVGTATEGERFALPLPAGLPPGYHRLAVECRRHERRTGPDRCSRMLPSAAAARTARAQLGPDLPALWVYAAPEIGEWAILPTSQRSPVPPARAAPSRSASIRSTHASPPNHCISAPIRRRAGPGLIICISTRPRRQALPRTKPRRH